MALLNLGIQSFRASYTQRLSFNEHGRNLSLLCRSITNVAGQNSVGSAIVILHLITQSMIDIYCKIPR